VEKQIISVLEGDTCRLANGKNEMGSIAFLHHDTFLSHLNPEIHPESPDRLAAIDEAIADSDLSSRLVRVPPRAATSAELCEIHSDRYIEKLEGVAETLKNMDKFAQLDGDTFMSASTYDAAKLAAGAGLIAVESVKSGGFATSFVAARPPGHHARASRQMGFCLINNIALAGRYARQQLGYRRVFLPDWGVPPGNSTQETFYQDPSVCFVSLHQFPPWPPNSGWFTEDGAKEGKGYNINIPLPAGTGDRGHLAAWDQIVTPVCLEYQPDLILLSAGYDAHQLDPLGEQEITTVGYAMLSQRLLELSNLTGAKVVSFLEGGYNKRALGDSVVATLRILSADSPLRLDEVQASYLATGSSAVLKPVSNDHHPDAVDQHIDAVRKHFAPYWQSLRK
jgi:acetoin utilization deacetylase AcuC-like enzyme